MNKTADGTLCQSPPEYYITYSSNIANVEDTGCDCIFKEVFFVLSVSKHSLSSFHVTTGNCTVKHINNLKCFHIVIKTVLTNILITHFFQENTEATIIVSQITKDTPCPALLIISLELSPLKYISLGLTSFMGILGVYTA